MPGVQKLRGLVYGLGAVGGTVAVFATVLEVLHSERRSVLQTLYAEVPAPGPQHPAPGSQHPAPGPQHPVPGPLHPAWDPDWDRREPTGEDRRNNNVPSATRHIILIRHGQYNMTGTSDKERILTALGRQQAAVTASRLVELALPYSTITHSNMSRAVETAELISGVLPGVPLLPADGILREGSPILPEPRVSSWRPEHHYAQDGARIEAAFRKYFHRAAPGQAGDSYELIVCHANVIRYFACRALQLPPEAWLRISLKHASLTWLAVRPDGRVSCRALGESGHFPPALLTTS